MRFVYLTPLNIGRRLNQRGASYIRHFSRSNVNNEDYEIPFTNRSPLKLTVGKLAQFADGCGVAQLGDTSVLVTSVCKSKPSSSSFLPLTVDYRQKAAAAGRIPTNHLRRELGPTEREILTSRLIDRSVRPLFPSNFFYEIQIICNLLAVDGIHDPEVLCINAASLSLCLSDIPWNGPVGAVRVGLLGSDIVINPTRKELSQSDLNLVVTATSQNLVVMLEASANDVLQQDFLKAIKAGVKECQKIVQVLSQIRKQHGRPKREVDVIESNESLSEAVNALCTMRLKEIFQNTNHDKLSRDDAVKDLRLDAIEKLKQETQDFNQEQFNDCFNNLCKSTFRNLILDNEIRCDGRGLTQLRPITCQVDLFKPLHGSALFQRGQTQVLCTVTLDSVNSALHMDPVSMITSGLKEKNFFLHYEFPPYAIKEVGRVGLTARREVGHGALAEKALRPVVPSNYPFTIRLTSEVLQSNGSSSMATICGGSLALMDAGVPLTNPAAGVAIGLVTKYSGNDTKHIENYKVLTDILGIEDYMGDMDFKIAGTKKGITALQADIKIPGLPLKVVMESVQAGCDAKAEILEIMRETIKEERKEKKNAWPVTDTIDIPIFKRGKFIGPGGMNLKSLFLKTGV